MVTDRRAPGRQRGWSARRQLTAFLFIAYAASWWAWPLVLLNPTTTALVPIGPSIAAIVVTAVAGGRGDLRELLGRLVRWRVRPVWYAAAFLLPVVLFGLPALLMIAFGVPADRTRPFPWAALPLLFAVRTIVGGPLGEELGWRGFLLPLLRRRHGPVAAGLLVGAAWAPFHLPAMVSGPAVDQRPVLPFLVWVFAASVLHAWMYERTGGSVLLVTLFHGGLNTAASLLMPLFSGAAYGAAWWLAAAVMVVAALVTSRRGWPLPSTTAAR